MRDFFASIRVKVLCVLIAPVLSLLFVSGEQLYVEWKLYRSHASIVPLSEMAELSSAVLDSLQVERGKTVGLINAGFAGPLVEGVNEQRRISDERIAKFRAAVERNKIAARVPDMREDFAHLDSQLSLIPDHRAAVDAKQMTLGDNVAFYTGIIEQSITLISHIIEHSPSQHVNESLLPFYTLVVAKENSGLERALGSAILDATAKGQFSMDAFLRYYGRLVAEQRALHEFRDFAQADQLALLETTLSGPIVEKVETWRKVLRDLPVTRDTQGIDPQAWFAAATDRIKLMKQVEDSMIAAAQATAQHELDEIVSEAILLLVLDLLSLFVAIAVGFYFAVKIATPVKALAETTGALAAGDLDQEVPYQEAAGELGKMARAIGAYKTASQEVKRLHEQQEQQEQRARDERNRAIRELCDSIEREITKGVEEVADETRRLISVSHDMRSATETVQNNAETVSHSASDSLSSAETVASATTELSSSISEVAQRTKSAAEVSDEAAERSTNTMQIVSGLSDAARDIGNVVKVISDIAEQTNLLALNATIEAARAGDAGRGFAVVAGEVKNLANQTQNSTAEIEKQISEIQEIADSAVESMGAIAETIARINNSMGDVADSVTQQDQATQEINQSVNESAAGARTVTERIAEVSKTTSGISELAGDVSSASQVLDERVSELRSNLTRMVRTAVPEADRRQHPRFDLGLTGTLTIGGQDQAVTLRDVNEIGACLVVADDGTPTLGPGAEAQLAIASLGLSVSVKGMKSSERGLVITISDKPAVQRLVSAGKQAAQAA